MAIVLACLGLLFNQGTFDQMHDDVRFIGRSVELGFYGRWMTLSYAFGWLVFALHLTAGVAATTYRKAGPRLVSAYATAALASAIAELAVASFAYPELGFPTEYFDGLRREIAIASMVWPLIALILINLRRARRACTR